MQGPSLAGSRALQSASLPVRRYKSVGTSKPVYAGMATKGRIKLLVRGQGSGIISAPRGNVFFHKTDVDGKFWDLSVGDSVVFELLEDSISGPRALHVRPARQAKVR